MLRRRGLENAFSLFAFQDIITSVTGVIILVTLMLAVELSKRKPSSTNPGVESAAEQVRSRLADVGTEVAALRVLIESDKSFIEEVASMPPSEIARSEVDLVRRVNELHDSLRNLRATETLVQGRLAVDVSSLGGLSEAALKQLQSKNAELLEQLEAIKSSNRVVYNPNPSSHKSAWLIDLQDDRIEVTVPGQDKPPLTFRAAVESSRASELLAWAQLRDKDSEYFVLLVRPESVGLYQIVYDKLNDLGFDLGFDLLGSDIQVTTQFPASRSDK